MRGDLALEVVMLFSGELLTVFPLGGLGWVCCVTAEDFPLPSLSPRPLPTCAWGGGKGWGERCSGGVAVQRGGAREGYDCLTTTALLQANSV